MVLKPIVLDGDMDMEFENDVKMYGTQACCSVLSSTVEFKNDVKMYGTQALYRA